MVSKRPTNCPFCWNDVERARPHEIHVPPDEREREGPGTRRAVGVADEDDFPEAAMPSVFQTASCVRLDPCEHLFREDDFEAWESGEIRALELGDRVVNPGRRQG